MAVGGLNPCPFQVGGGPAETEKVYTTMRRAVGVGGSAVDDNGIEGLWRKSRAAGIAAVGTATVRAVNQFWPHLATDALPYFARVVDLHQWVDEPEADFRARVWQAWVARLLADLPSLEASLQAIDPRISFVSPSFTTTTQEGRAFEPLWPAGESPAFETSGGCSIAPFYTTEAVLFVHFDVGYAGPPILADQRIMESVKEHLRKVLPSWQSFQIFTAIGFILDTTPLDITGFGA